MRSSKIKMLFMLALILMAGTTVNAMPASGKAHGLSLIIEGPKSMRYSLRMSRLKEMQELKLKIAENRAHFNVLMNSENPDMNALYKNIDEYTILRQQLKKSRLQIFNFFTNGFMSAKL